MFKYINFPIFLISLSIGLLFTYLAGPDNSIIYVYPTPNNLDSVSYRDRAGTCFKFNKKEVSCPKTAKDIPLQV
mgnify:CR=1 FL=1